MEQHNLKGEESSQETHHADRTADLHGNTGVLGVGWGSSVGATSRAAVGGSRTRVGAGARAGAAAGARTRAGARTGAGARSRARTTSGVSRVGAREEVLVDAVVDALGVLGGLLSGAVTLLAAGDTLGGGIGTILVGVGDLFGQKHAVSTNGAVHDNDDDNRGPGSWGRQLTPMQAAVQATSPFLQAAMHLVTAEVVWAGAALLVWETATVVPVAWALANTAKAPARRMEVKRILAEVWLGLWGVGINVLLRSSEV